jgi:hypothetical protein
MLKNGTVTPQQPPLDLYSTLFLALPTDNLSVIENVNEANKSCGFQARMTLLMHYEDDGIYHLAKRLQYMEKPQKDSESSLQYLSRLARLQRQVARVEEDGHDR